MALPESVLNQPASSKYAIWIAGGDTLFLTDLCVGQRVFIGSRNSESSAEFRRMAASLAQDLKTLTIGEFFDKYGLIG